MNHAPIHVLHVEDDPVEAEHIRHLLCGAEESPFRIEPASSLDEAVRGVESRPPDLILLDLGLPDSRGLDTVARMRSRAEAVPIVVLTAGEDVSLATEAIRAGAQDCIAKSDVSERILSRILRFAIERRIHEGRRQTAKAMQAQKLQALGRLVAGVAHEINNPLSYLMTNVNTMSDYFSALAGTLAASEKALERVVVEATTRLREVQELRSRLGIDEALSDGPAVVLDAREGAERIRDLVQNLKGIPHRDDRPPQPVDLRNELDRAIHVCGTTSAEIRTEYQELPPVPGFPRELGQVFLNLIQNAAQAVNGDGRIVVSLGREDPYAVVRVRDNGCGIPAENQSKVFEPFFTTKSANAGTGLGLHIAREIVLAHGGTIQLRSEVGEGTEFTIRLPLAQEPPAPSNGKEA